MGSQRPSSSEKGRRKARSTGTVPSAALCPAVFSSPVGFYSLLTLFRASTPFLPLHPMAALFRPENLTLLSSWSLLCTLSSTGLALTQPPALSL